MNTNNELPNLHLLSATPIRSGNRTESAQIYAGQDISEIASYFDDVDTTWDPSVEEPSPIEESHGPQGFDIAQPSPHRYSRGSSSLRVFLAISVLAAIIAVSAFVGIFFLSSDARPSQERQRAVVSDTAKVHTSPGTGSSGPGDEQPDTPPSDPMFSWWGDRLSANSLRYSPAIGITGHAYFWHADNEGTSALEVINTIERVRLAEEEGHPDKVLGTLGGTVVFAFGNTEDISAKTLTKLREAVGDQRTLVLVGVGSLNNKTQPWRVELNSRFAQFAQTTPNTRFVDWQARVDANPGYVTDEGNLTQAGTYAWANLVNQEIKDIYS